MPTCWHFSRKVSKWPHRTNPAFTLMRRPGVHFDCLEAGRSKGTTGNYAIVGVTSGYVEKKTRGLAVPVADCPQAIGAGFAETGCFFASAMSSLSILRCSCEMGRVDCVIQKV